MKYDPEYNSYKFSDFDLTTIVKALDFYSQYSPLLEQSQRESVSSLIQSLENSKHITT